MKNWKKVCFLPQLTTHLWNSLLYNIAEAKSQRRIRWFLKNKISSFFRIVRLFKIIIMDNKKIMLFKGSCEKGSLTPCRFYTGKRQSWNKHRILMRHVLIFNFSEVRVPGAYSSLLASCRVSYHSWPQPLSSSEFWISSVTALMMMLEPVECTGRHKRTHV